MTNARVVTFDIANATFDFYTQEMWDNQVQEWRDDAFSDGIFDDRDTIENMDENEIAEYMYGDELFIEHIPEEVK